jgi:mannose-1-phosphate guanylyltransferase
VNTTDNPGLWTVVLAGGDGVRLRQLTRALHGEELPKQFALIHGGTSLLQATVARAKRWSAPERIVVVVAHEREALARAQLRDYGPVHLAVQPCNRGTGPGVLLPLSHVLAMDPSAHVVILPSDHYVRDEAPFEQSIRAAIAASEEQIALIGAVPDHAETQYGWMVRGVRPDVEGHVVECFCEKPPANVAQQLLRDGALWNTFVMAGSVQRFWSLASQHLPQQASRFETYLTALNGPEERMALRALYARMPVADFSRDVLERARDLRLVPLRTCGWSDWGTPERVLHSLRNHSDYGVLSRRLALTAAAAG